jgi:excisionase family DNA binding protein
VGFYNCIGVYKSTDLWTCKTKDNMPKVLSVKETAVALGVHPATVYVWCTGGKIPARQIGRKWLIPADALAEFLNPKPKEAPTQ